VLLGGTPLPVVGFLSVAPAGLLCFMLCSPWFACILPIDLLRMQALWVDSEELVLGLGESLA
jgi:hypothetical protein